MHEFASGGKRNYYGKADVSVYRLQRPRGVFGANVTMVVYGDAFWLTYTRGDNTTLIATDSMKNFIQWETMNFEGDDLESYCRFLAEKFLTTYPQTEGIQVSAMEIPYLAMAAGSAALAPAGPDRAMARMEMTREGVVESRAGIHGFKLLRLSGSAFAGFVRDQYTTLPDQADRPLHIWLDVEWLAAGGGRLTAQVRETVHGVFDGFESGSIQQVIHQMGTKILADLPAVEEVRLEANNRTWDTVAERGAELGVYTDPRPPYGVLGLTLRR